MPALFIFVLLPLIEIGLFIAVGAQIGVLATLGLIVLSALLGASILRGQQAQAQSMMQGGLRVAPGTFLAQGAFRVLAGLLLLLPGFLTDALGLLLLIPPLQRMIVRALGLRAGVVSATVWRQDDVVEGDYTVRDPAHDPLPATQRLRDDGH